MLLKLIKTRPMITGVHAELWQIDAVFGDTHLADVFILNEHLPLGLIYPVHVTPRGLWIRKDLYGWQWDNPKLEGFVIEFLLEIQSRREEIFIDICDPEPDLPGYPYTDYHPDDFPIVLEEI